MNATHDEIVAEANAADAVFAKLPDLPVPPAAESLPGAILGSAALPAISYDGSAGVPGSNSYYFRMYGTGIDGWGEPVGWNHPSADNTTARDGGGPLGLTSLMSDIWWELGGYGFSTGTGMSVANDFGSSLGGGPSPMLGTAPAGAGLAVLAELQAGATRSP